MVEDLVEVAFVGSEPQAEMVQALLTEQGIPSLQQQVGPSGPQLGYGLLGAYGRALLFSAGAMVLAFGVFLLLRAI